MIFNRKTVSLQAVSSRDTLFAGELYESAAAAVDAILNSLTSPGAGRCRPLCTLAADSLQQQQVQARRTMCMLGLLTAALAVWAVMQCVA
jgi:hypothetical protein